jgi:hypothetical protein
VSREMKLLRNLVGDNRDTLCMRVIVTFKLVDSLRKLCERFSRTFID